MSNRGKQMAVLGVGVLSFGLAASALADPPDRVARLAYSSGAVSFAPAGQEQWNQAELNRPVIPGDRLWTDASGRDELQIGSAAVRMQGDTLVNVINLDDRVVQLQLSQGRLNVRVRELAPDGVFEIDTPSLALTIREPGDYRIDVDPDGAATTVIVHNGEAQADGQGASWTINAGQAYRFNGADLRNYQLLALAPPDEFDRWAATRDRRIEQSPSARYVPRDLVGYDDLDDNGSWRNVSGYGDVWTPSHVAAGWTPYRDGHWSWVEPWGWTWVDDAPWGFAVSHYGRWANMGGNWGWIPGPVHERPVYAPALVAFVGGAALLGAGRGGVAWFPLGPREVYRPAYHVSQNYFNNINISNTNLNRSQVVNVYNNHTTNINYINRQVNGAVVAVPVATFAQSRPVGRAAVAVSRQSFDHAPVSQGAGVQPQRGAGTGGAPAGHAPSAAVMSRPVVARTAPPRQMGSFGGQPMSRPAPQVKMLGAVAPARPIAAAGAGGHGALPVAANGQPVGQSVARQEALAARPGAPMTSPTPTPTPQHVPAQVTQHAAAQVPGHAATPVAAGQPQQAQQARQQAQEQAQQQAQEQAHAPAAAAERHAVHNPQMRPAAATPPSEPHAAVQPRAEPEERRAAAPVRQVAQPQPPQQHEEHQPQAQPQRQEAQHQPQAQPQRQEAQHQAAPQHQEAVRQEPPHPEAARQEAHPAQPHQEAAHQEAVHPEAAHPPAKPAPQAHPEAKHEGKTEGKPDEHKQ